MAKKIYQEFKKMVDSYEMITGQDIIAVEVSAEANSVAVLDCLMEYAKEVEKGIALRFFVVQGREGITAETRQVLETYKISNYTVLSEKEKEVYEIIRREGCTKVALSHNYNDILNSTFMTLLERKEVAEIHPKRESSNEKNLEFIRPLCTVEDAMIQTWMEEQDKTYTQEVSMFSKMACLEEKIVMPNRQVNTQFKFNIYERV